MRAGLGLGLGAASGIGPVHALTHYTLQEDVAKYDELFQQERKLG